MIDWNNDNTLSEVSSASTTASVIHQKPGFMGFRGPALSYQGNEVKQTLNLNNILSHK
jgi:hypothetical protein